MRVSGSGASATVRAKRFCRVASDMLACGRATADTARGHSGARMGPCMSGRSFMIRNMAKVSSTFQMDRSVLRSGRMATREAIKELQTLSKGSLTCKMLSNSSFAGTQGLNRFKSNNKLKQMFSRINHQKWYLPPTINLHPPPLNNSTSSNCCLCTTERVQITPSKISSSRPPVNQRRG